METMNSVILELLKKARSMYRNIFVFSKLITLYMVFALSLYPETLLASVVQTTPEFECTVVEFKDPTHGLKLFGAIEYPTLVLRRFASGDWQMSINNKTSIIANAEINKYDDYINKMVSYGFTAIELSWIFEIKGVAPSRYGLLSVKPNPLALPKIIAGLTCH
jgi:hypothetical protein